MNQHFSNDDVKTVIIDKHDTIIEVVLMNRHKVKNAYHKFISQFKKNNDNIKILKN